jgi:hypothetical protein
MARDQEVGAVKEGDRLVVGDHFERRHFSELPFAICGLCNGLGTL